MKNFQSVLRLAILAVSLLFIGLALNVLPLSQNTAEAKITEETPSARNDTLLDEDNPLVKRVKEVQERHARDLMSLPDVVGTAVGMNEESSPVIIIFTRKQVGKGMIPDELEGIPVSIEVTGDIFALGSIKPSSKFPMPVPVGVSTGNINECSAGTIGARVKDLSGNIFALSNNHVYALENKAAIGSAILQPGLYDSGCLSAGNNVIGSLYSFVPIDFSGGNNTIDAAIARTSISQVSNATPPDGYGKANSRTYYQATGKTAQVGQSVRKYGRTTGLTTGTVRGINVTVRVCYNSSCSLLATFVNQISVGGGGFSQAGDSGSLIVTNDANAYPVGLLFAGGSGITFGNLITPVLDGFSVAIDGK